MAKTPKVNVRKIQRALRHAKADLRRFDMTGWGSKMVGKDVADGEDGFVQVNPKDIPPCGTKACLGGWLVLLEKKTQAARNRLFNEYGDMKGPVFTKALRLAGFTTEEGKAVFTGSALDPETPAGQYRQVVRNVNRVLADRGLKARVK